MKNNLLKYYITAFYLCSTFIAFAQPGDEDATNTLEGDEPSAPIDGYLWVLGIIGLAYVFLLFRGFAQQREIKN